MGLVCCEGDPKLYDNGDGAEIRVVDGQPVMDEGLENAVYISLFSGSWWGNLVSSADEKCNSELETLNRNVLTNKTRLDVERFAQDALAWMVNSGIAKKITVSSLIPSVGMLAIFISIEEPNRTVGIQYSINWATMAVRVGAA